MDSNEQSCIVFEIHIRVDEDDTAKSPSQAEPPSLGKAKGWRTEVSGDVDGVKLRNVETAFSYRQPDQVDDGTILLVTPLSEANRTLPVYEEFLRSLVFGR